MKLIFERSVKGRGLDLLPSCDVEVVSYDQALLREKKLNLPELSETEISRHYTTLMKESFGVNDGCYPLGSCTMKYNPKINDEIAKMPEFSNIHPLQSQDTIQGCLEVLKLAEEYLCEITGMDHMSFQPSAGAHGEFTGLLLMRAYHESRRDTNRKKIIVPDSAHGTNPASATMAGYKVVNIPSTTEGFVDLEELDKVLGDDIAGFMLTNPNTLGLFDKNILKITDMVHKAGGLCYYDGANLNAIMGYAKPGDMGFDVIHLNLHKTFSTPHGGGGPGGGPVGCKKFLSKFLPRPSVVNNGGTFTFTNSSKDSIGRVKDFYGNFLVVVRALTYILTLGAEGLKSVSANAVLNANYMLHHLKDKYEVPFKDQCMHEFVLSVRNRKKDRNVTALDIAKRVLDYGIHPPTMYFPLIIHEALMFEPTETESKETLDEVIDILNQIYGQAMEETNSLWESPKTTIISRPDEVYAARNPVLRYKE